MAALLPVSQRLLASAALLVVARSVTGLGILRLGLVRTWHPHTSQIPS
jgi:hypothetical protein